jgi:hypothetical protein
MAEENQQVPARPAVAVEEEVEKLSKATEAEDDAELVKFAKMLGQVLPDPAPALVQQAHRLLAVRRHPTPILVPITNLF